METAVIMLKGGINEPDAFVKVSIAVTRHHDYDNSYKGQHSARAGLWF